MRYDSCYLNLPQNGSLPRGGGLGGGQGYKFQKTYAFAWFGKMSNGYDVLDRFPFFRQQYAGASRSLFACGSLCTHASSHFIA